MGTLAHSCLKWFCHCYIKCLLYKRSNLQSYSGLEGWSYQLLLCSRWTYSKHPVRLRTVPTTNYPIPDANCALEKEQCWVRGIGMVLSFIWRKSQAWWTASHDKGHIASVHLFQMLPWAWKILSTVFLFSKLKCVWVPSTVAARSRSIIHSLHVCAHVLHYG